MQYRKKNNLVHLTLLNHEQRDVNVTFVDIIAQVPLTRGSILFLDVLTWKLRIIIIILLTDRPDIILPTACTTNN